MEDLLQKIADLEGKLLDLQVGFCCLIMLVWVCFICLLYLICYLVNTIKLSDPIFRMFDALPFRYRRKLMRSNNKVNKERVNEFCDNMDAHNVD